MNQKRVAIIGAGQAGLVSAKYALANGLKPTIFEKSGHIGGLWAPETPIWSNLFTNVSKYTMMFSDHPWPKSSPIFSSKKQVQTYLESYAERFKVQPHIKLRNQILEARPVNDNKWQLDYMSLDSNQAQSEKFDFLIVASGLHGTARIPQFENASIYKGPLMHSSQFKLSDPQLKNKRVLLIGFNVSGIDISTNLVGHAESVVNVFRRPYLVASRLIATRHATDKSKFCITTFDLHYYKRCIAFPSYGNLSKEEKKLKRKQSLQAVFSQTHKDRCHPALYFDVDDEKQETLLTISDSYLDLVEAGKIKPKRSNIKEFTADGVLLEDGSFEQADAVIYCTGYDLRMDYMCKTVLDKIRVSNEINYKFQYNLHKFTFHPEVENFALVGQLDGLFQTGAELQARLASSVFTGQIVFDKAKARGEIEKQRAKMMSNKRRAQFPYGTYVELCEKLGKEMDLVPDFEAMKANDPQLYDMFWNDSAFSAHYLYKANKSYASDMMREVHEMTNRVYELNDEADLKFPGALKKFSEFYTFQKAD
jgi:dimethylaniline monooxygenase (N-oxide forming)